MSKRVRLSQPFRNVSTTQPIIVGGRGKVNHKGRNRHFITEAEMEAEREKERKDREWKQRRGNDDDDKEEGTAEKEEQKSDESEEDSDEESDSDEEEKVRKPKGVDGLIEVQNLNRAQKVTKKVAEFDIHSQVNLSRREREELERQQAHTHYLKMQAEGKTEQAQKDLARLAIIRKQREELAKKREEAKQTPEPKSKK